MIRPFFFAAATLVATSVVAVSAPKPAVGSNYPPNYVVERTCQTNGPVEVCALNRQYSNYPRVTVRYDGYLLASQWGRISAYVRVNGRDGIFRMTNANYNESVVVGDPAVRLCWATGPGGAPSGDPPNGGQYGWCTHTAGQLGALVWEADALPAADQNVLFYTRNANGQANAWDVSVSFTSDDGRWDSRYGQNYNFRFE